MCYNLNNGSAIWRNQKAACVQRIIGIILLSAVKTIGLTIKFITQHTIYGARNAPIFCCFVKSAVRHAYACLINWSQTKAQSRIA